jgi:hypothetical protein
VIVVSPKVYSLITAALVGGGFSGDVTYREAREAKRLSREIVDMTVSRHRSGGRGFSLTDAIGACRRVWRGRERAKAARQMRKRQRRYAK